MSEVRVSRNGIYVNYKHQKTVPHLPSVFLTDDFLDYASPKKCVSWKVDPVESTWCWWLCSIYQCFQPGAGRHLGRPGQKTSVFTLWFALLVNRSPCPATPMLKQNSTSLSQDLGLINPDQGTRIKTNVLLGQYWCFRALILGFRTNWLGLKVCLASLDQLRQAYRL